MTDEDDPRPRTERAAWVTPQFEVIDTVDARAITGGGEKSPSDDSIS